MNKKIIISVYMNYMITTKCLNKRDDLVDRLNCTEFGIVPHNVT